MAHLAKYVIGISMTAASIAIVQAIVSMVLATVVLVSFDDCWSTATTNAGTNYFNILVNHYLKDDSCKRQIGEFSGLVTSQYVYIWIILILCTSASWFIFSIGLILVSDGSNVDKAKRFPKFSYFWSCGAVVTSLIDISMSILFAVDLHRLNGIMSNLQDDDGDAYDIDLLRFSAFAMMSLSFRGYILLLANVAFAIIIPILGYNTKKSLAAGQHSMHTHGALNAFSINPYLSDTKYDDELEFNRPQPPWLKNGKSFDRSNSWYHTKPNEERIQRPMFIEELKIDRTPIPASSPSSSIVAPWAHNRWSSTPPPVPFPDYSPHAPRKLKSALKST